MNNESQTIMRIIFTMELNNIVNNSCPMYEKLNVSIQINIAVCTKTISETKPK